MDIRSTTLRITNESTYTIQLVHNELEKVSEYFLEPIVSERALVIVDEQVHLYHRDWIESCLGKTFRYLSSYIVPSGEKSKNLSQFGSLLHWILEQPIERNTPVIVIGGGVVGDLGGFVAASTLRGLPLFHIPTTLLAMVDSSIGGKTGINHSTGKNVIGSFYQPVGVFADTHFLSTLDKKEWTNGLSEILKYACIQDQGIFTSLKALFDHNLGYEPSKWVDIIHRSAQIKTEIVAEDALEKGRREYLNFGHTFGHAIENIADYGTFSHGEAVFAGMYAAILASNEFLNAQLDPNLILQYAPRYDFSLASLRSVIPDLIQQMRRDKKVQQSHIRLVLLQSIEAPIAYTVQEEDRLTDIWKQTIDMFS